MLRILASGTSLTSDRLPLFPPLLAAVFAAIAAVCPAIADTFGAESSHASIHRLDRYAANLAHLREKATNRGSISYAEVLTAAYSDEIDLSAALEAKRVYRSRAPEWTVFLSDYATVKSDASVTSVSPIRNRQMGSTMIGRYESRAHAIKIAYSASDFALVHEAGHALQRTALVDRSIKQSNSVTFTPIELSLRNRTAPGLDPLTAKRLLYLASQDEFEVRLQDLNRFYAVVVSGRPIESPLDALEALSALGLSVGLNEARGALNGARGGYTDAQIERRLRSGASVSSPQNGLNVFDDACELLMLQNLARQIDGDLWALLLKKILLEAPGHL